MPDTLTPNYTKEELENAKKELEAMSPEELLNLRTQIELAQDAVNLPEAPAIAWMELRAASGAKINLTIRASSGQMALDGLASAIAYARERYGMNTTSNPVSQAQLPMQDIPPLSTEEPKVSAPSNSIPFSAVSAPTISYTPIASASPTVEIEVQSITRERKRDGKGDFLRVRGGKFVKFGIPCYPEHFPQGLDVSQMQYGLEFNNIPPFMKVALATDEKPYHVLSFHA